MTQSPVKFGGPFDLDQACFQMPDKRRFVVVRAIFRSLSPMAWALAAAALAVGTIIGFILHNPWSNQ